MDTPSLTDGRRAPKDSKLENLSVLSGGTPLRLHFISHALKRAARTHKHILEGEDVHLGFDIRSAGPLEGPLNFQLNKATDTPPSGAHVLKLTTGTKIQYFGVTEGDESVNRGQAIRGTVNVLEMLNPFFQGLLTADLGDSKQLTVSKASGGATEVVTTNPQNHRTGSTKAYSATLADGSALPTGVVCDSGTGVITITKATIAVGVYEIVVVATDTVTTLPAGHPWAVLEGEATLHLTITA